MRLVNTNPLGAIDLPLIGRTLAAGEAFDIDDDLGVALLEQVGNYELAKPAKGSAPTTDAQEG